MDDKKFFKCSMGQLAIINQQSGDNLTKLIQDIFYFLTLSILFAPGCVTPTFLTVSMFSFVCDVETDIGHSQLATVPEHRYYSSLKAGGGLQVIQELGIYSLLGHHYTPQNPPLVVQNIPVHKHESVIKHSIHLSYLHNMYFRCNI